MNSATARRAAEFAAVARQLADERSSAGDVVAERLRATPRDEWPKLAEDPALHNNGALERLSKEVHTLLDRQPADALPLSALAVSISEMLPDDRYPAVVMAQIRAHAWKDRAQALWMNGKHEDAFDAISRADETLKLFATVAHDRALVRLVMASILQNLGRFDESFRLLAQCRKVFDEHHDQKLLLNCGINEAVALARQRRFEEAAAILETLLRTTCKDTAALAAVHHNLGIAFIELGRVVEANVHISHAVAFLNDAGNHVGALRAELATGRLFASKGRTTEALVRLRSAQQSFFARGLNEEGALCGLDIAALLLDENRLAEAEKMFESIREQLPEANGRAQAALMELAQHFVAHDVTPAAVRHVSELIAGLRSEKNSQSARA